MTNSRRPYFTDDINVSLVSLQQVPWILNNFTYLKNFVQKKPRDPFPAAKIRKEEFRKVFNVLTKSHFSNFDVG